MQGRAARGVTVWRRVGHQTSRGQCSELVWRRGAGAALCLCALLAVRHACAPVMPRQGGAAAAVFRVRAACIVPG